MAQFQRTASLQRADLRKVDQGDSLVSLGATLKEVDIQEKKIDFDFQDSMNSVVEEARKRSEKSSASIEVGRFGGAADGLLDLGALQRESVVDKLLREAVRLMQQEQDYAAARQQLELLLAEEADHAEATFLMAACFYEGGGADMDALRWVARLSNRALDRSLRGRVNALRDEIRDRLITKVMLETMLLGKLGGYKLVLPKLRELATLDPQTGQYHLLLVGALVSTGQMDEAMSAVVVGLEKAESGTGALRGMKEHIDRQMLQRVLGPVVELFRERKFKKARKLLGEVAGGYMHLPLAAAFDAWLKQLSKGGFLSFLGFGKNRDIKPPEDDEHEEQLYFLVLGPDLASASALMKRGKFEEALSTLKEAVGMAPSFRYLHYLLGGCYYRMAGKALTGGAPDIDEQLELLQKAEKWARTGAEDSEISGAGPLHAAIEAALNMMREVADQVRKRQAEAKRLNAAIETYGAIMEEAGSGIDSVKTFDRIYGKMRSLKNELSSLERDLVSDSARNAFSQLEEAVSRSLGQLDSMKGSIADQRHVEGCMTQFSSLMQQLNSGKITPSSCQSKFRSLLSDVKKARGKVSSSEARQALDQLEDVLGQRISELDSMAEVELVNGHMKLFNQFMEMLNSDGFQITSRSQLESIRDGLRNMQSNVDRDARSASSSEARAALQKLSSAMDNVLSQLG